MTKWHIPSSTRDLLYSSKTKGISNSTFTLASCEWSNAEFLLKGMLCYHHTCSPFSYVKIRSSIPFVALCSNNKAFRGTLST